MARELRAFVSYRRLDHFEIDAATDEVYQDKSKRFSIGVCETLKVVGFGDVFLDDAIAPVKGWLDEIYNHITGCDLFILLIGKNWLDLLLARQNGGDDVPDILVGEIELALSHDKNILPVLVDGAEMPPAHLLPRSIRGITQIEALQLSSTGADSSNEITLSERFASVNTERKLGPVWFYIYFGIGFLAWFFTGIAPNIAGIWEFGWESWAELAIVWGGLFIWPIVFIPFALGGLYRPVRAMAEQIVVTKSWLRRLKYIAPFVISAAIGVLGARMDVIADEVVWTIKPTYGPICGTVQSREKSDGPLPAKAFFEYDGEGENNLKGRYEARDGYTPFWLEAGKKCWPNVFFYMTMPVIMGFGADDAYSQDRAEVIQTYKRLEKYGVALNIGFERSLVFYFYAISMFVLVTLLAMGIVFTIYYAVFGVDDPRNAFRKLEMPVEDAYLGLLFAFISLMMWHPFRLITTYFKSVVCTAGADGSACILTWNKLFNDTALMLILLLGYAVITVGLFIKKQKLKIFIISGLFVSAVLLLSFLTLFFKEGVMQVLGRFQLLVIILTTLALFFLWMVVDPGNVRREKFREKYFTGSD